MLATPMSGRFLFRPGNRSRLRHDTVHPRRALAGRTHDSNAGSAVWGAPLGPPRAANDVNEPF
jgi:hypothetical protein